MSDKTARAYPKTDARYWLTSGKLIRDPRSPSLCCKIQFQGRRESFPLNSSSKDAAAKKAAGIYRDVVAMGWKEALARHKPEPVKKVKVGTIGGLIAEVQATAGIRPSTLNGYAQSLRQIAAEIAGVEDQPQRDADGQAVRNKQGKPILRSRFDYRTGGRDAWMSVVNGLSLTSLSADAVQRWRLSHIEKAGHAPDARRRAENSASSTIRNARSLFSEKALQFARSALELPDPLPFQGIKLPKKGNNRYQSKIDAPSLIAAALKELSGAPLQIFLLAMMCGLRKREIDLLTWSQVDLESGQIHIERTEFFAPKSEDSIGVVDLEPELVPLMKEWKRSREGKFVIPSHLPPRHDVSRVNYRCEPSFVALYAWLRAKGVVADKPLHELRKELGAILANEQGIFAAQSVLRHAQIGTTAEYYVDKKQRITGGLGSFLDSKALKNAEEGQSRIISSSSHVKVAC